MSLSRRHLAIAAVAVLGAGAGWMLLAPVATRQSAPQFEYTLLDGQRRDSRQLKGQVVLVNFWATSCGTCVAEMPDIVTTFGKYRDRGYQTIAVAMQYDPPAYVAHFAESRKLPFGVAIDHTGEIAQRFGQVQLTPTTFLIDKRGQIVKRYVGKPDFAALHALVEKLLAEA